MAKKSTPTKSTPTIGQEGARLTREQAVNLVMSNWIHELADDESMCDFLLLLYTIAGIEDYTERDGFVIEIESELMPLSPSMSQAMTKLLERRLAVAYSPVKEGGTQ